MKIVTGRGVVENTPKWWTNWFMNISNDNGMCLSFGYNFDVWGMGCIISNGWFPFQLHVLFIHIDFSWIR